VPGYNIRFSMEQMKRFSLKTSPYYTKNLSALSPGCPGIFLNPGIVSMIVIGRFLWLKNKNQLYLKTLILLIDNSKIKITSYFDKYNIQLILVPD
jgi:hypothetical protein